MGKSPVRLAFSPVLLGAFLLLVAGCQAIFTFSPVQILAQDPSKLSSEQKQSYGQEALASGDSENMQAAYTALASELAASTDPAVHHLAANLAMELSGVPTVLQSVVAGELELVVESAGDIEDLLNSEDLNPALMIEAAAHLKNTKQNDGVLSTSDYIMGGLGLVLQASEDPAEPGTYNFDDPDSWDDDIAEEANDFLAEGADAIADLPDDDPAKQFLTGFQSFLDSL